MILKNSRVLNIYDSLEQMKTLKGTIFAYKVIKNQSLIESDYKTLQDVIKPTDKFKEYSSNRNDLMQKYFEQESTNTIKLKSDLNSSDYISELNILNEEYKEEIESREKQIIDLNLILSQDVDINFSKINKKDLPEELSLIQIDNILELIEEENYDDKIESSMKIIDIINYPAILEILNSINMGEKMKSLMIDNIKIIRNIWQEIIKEKEFVDYQKEYDINRINICEEYTERDEYNNPIMNDRQYKIKDVESFNVDINKLNEEKSEIIENYSNFLNKEKKLMFNDVKIENLPKDLNGNQIQFLSIFFEQKN
jgi:hypothetical protein